MAKKIHIQVTSKTNGVFRNPVNYAVRPYQEHLTVELKSYAKLLDVDLSWFEQCMALLLSLGTLVVESDTGAYRYEILKNP